MFHTWVLSLIVLADGGGGSEPSLPMGTPHSWFPSRMATELTQIPVEVKAGSLFHVRGYSKDTDTFRQNIPLEYVELGMYNHSLDVVGTLESGSLIHRDPIGQPAGGQINWDFAIQATADLGGEQRVYCHDSYRATDSGMEGTIPPDLMKDPDSLVMGYTVVVSVTGPQP